MRTLLALSTAAALLLLALGAPAALAEEAPLPSAREVVERHANDLGAALRIALRPALALASHSQRGA